jgi:hypothetical protein
MVHLQKMVKNTWGYFLVFFFFSAICCQSGWALNTGSISGTVLDDQGDPVEGLVVQVFSDRCWSDIFLGDATTDALGNYQVQGLPAQDVYVYACAGCTNINYIEQWWNDGEGTTDCGQAAAVTVAQGLETPDIDLTLSEGPRRIGWSEIEVNQGILGGGFDVLPGFEHLIVSVTMTGPDGFFYEFDLENDVYARLNECNYIVAWWKEFDDTFAYGEYTITIGFQDGVEISESHDLQQVDIFAVDINSMIHTVNPDGSMDFSWVSPVPGQVYRVRVYQHGERIYGSGMLKDLEVLHVFADELRCLVPGVEAAWEVRTYDDGSTPGITIEKSGYKQIDYTPQQLERSYWFEAVKRQGNPERLELYFNIRPGSRGQVTSAVVTGPEGFTPCTFDLVNDWFDMSTESRIGMKGWSNFRSAATEPILDGQYTLTVEFDDEYMETQTYQLSADDLTPVDADTMGYHIFENGAIWFEWSLPQGVSGQRYQVGIRSKDGSREYARAGGQIDSTSQYFSVWDLRTLPQGDQFTWFVRAISDDRDTRVGTMSNQLLTYNPFDITARGGSTFVLTATSPNLAITEGSDVVVYGTADPNEITLPGGAKAELVNFAGENLVVVQSDSDLFTVSRTGTVVTFQGTDGTILKIPVTTSGQTISFADRAPLTLGIFEGQVKLDDQIITTDPAAIQGS